MAIPNLPKEQPPDNPASSEEAFEYDERSPRETSGTGLSVALSLAFYVIVLAVGISYDHTHQLRGPHSDESDMYDAESALRSIYGPTFPELIVHAAGSDSMMRARARDCALAGQWDCVGEATQAALALPSAAPESPALLDVGNVYANWTPPRSAGAGAAYAPRYERLKVSARPEEPWDRWHLHRHSGMGRLGRVAITRHASPDYLADLYRH